MTTTALPHLPMFPAFAGTGNKALIAALEALPDYTAHEAAKTRVSTAMGEATSALMTATQAHLALVQRVTDTARADRPIPKGLPQQANETAAALTAAQAFVNVLREADQQLSQGRDQILTTAPDALLSDLSDQLEVILNEARQLGVESVSTAQEAIDAGLVEQWQRYLTLTVRHREIRAAQALVTGHLVGGDMASQHLSTFGQARNYADLFPKWYARAHGHSTSTLNGEPVYDSPPWSEGQAEGLWSYAVQHDDVDLWVPTARQLSAAVAIATTEARAAENAQAREDQGLPLTPDERARLDRRRHLERQYLNHEGVMR